MEKRSTQTRTGSWLDARSKGVSLIEHRNESVAVIDGVEYISDSKATDPRAVEETLMQIEKPVTLIMQISDTHENYSCLYDVVKYKVVSLVVFGTGSEELIRNSIGQNVDHFIRANDLQDAVSQSKSLTKTGGVVVFSPGCTSFSLFDDYRHRGDSFKAFVGGIFK